MTRELPTATTPWYRQFWPWVLIGLPGSVVVASLITIAIATHNSDSLVVDDYYKTGLAINRSLARDKAAAQIGLSADLRIEDDRLSLTLLGDPPTRPERITLRLVHSASADADRTLELARVQDQDYTTLFEPLPEGRWDLILETEDWRLSGALTQAEHEVRLTPSWREQPAD